MKISIAQKHRLGCGLACVAFLLNKDYQAIINPIFKIRAEKQGFYCKDLVKLLKKHGKNYTYKYIKKTLKKTIYKNNVIVYIKKSTKYPKGHFLVRSNKLWMDPWINFLYSKDIKNAKSGFRIRLPGKPIFALIPK